MRLIDADVLKAQFRTNEGASILGHCVSRLVKADTMVDDMPTIDAVPVVRCKDCKHYENHKLKVYENCVRNERYIPVLPNDFCSYGERRSDDGTAL